MAGIMVVHVTARGRLPWWDSLGKVSHALPSAGHGRTVRACPRSTYSHSAIAHACKHRAAHIVPCVIISLCAYKCRGMRLATARFFLHVQGCFPVFYFSNFFLCFSLFALKISKYYIHIYLKFYKRRVST